MCLTIPRQIISVKGGMAKIKSSKGQQEMGMLIKAKKGDWVLTQNDVIIKKINKKQVEEIGKIIKNFTKK